MAVKIRLARRGRKKLAMYDIVVADSKAPRDGRFIEKIGIYNPNTNPATIDLKEDAAFKWVMVGAEPTETVKAMLSYKGLLFKKHLQIGVAKGAITQEVADSRLEEWMKAKEAKISGKVEGLADKKDKAAKARKVAEIAKNEARAEAIVKKNTVVEEVAVEEEAEAVPVAEEVVAEVAPVAEDVVAEVAPVAGEVVAEVAPVAEEVVAEVAPVAEEVVAEVAPVAEEVVAEVAPVAEEVVAEVAPVAEEVVAEVAPVAEEVVAEVAPVAADDLKIVEGIGPKIADLLIAGGITTFSALASSSVEAIQAILDAAGPSYSAHNPGTWPKQADLAAKGEWDTLKVLQDELNGGK
jgi:small subunit ribosomal protein S16